MALLFECNEGVRLDSW